jgi:2-haloacid dehalogenase
MVEALIFDVFGTCVDWRTGVSREAAKVAAEKELDIDADAFADYWRGRYQPAMQRIRSGNRGYVALDDLHLENLSETLSAFELGAEFDAAERQAFNAAWEKLPPWPDVVEGLEQLKRRYILAPCSNGSIALMARLAKYGGLAWDAIVGAEVAQNYKPDPAVYLASVAALRLAPEQVMMVAAHNGDLAAARTNGLKTAFVPRPSEHGPGQTTDLEADSDWDVIADDFIDLAEKLAAV